MAKNTHIVKNKSAGILLYRTTNNKLQVLLVHMGGPYWAYKDEGTWTIPKGEFTENEDPLRAALREFKEETGFDAPANCIALEPVKQKSGKLIYAWAAEGNLDAEKIKSNTFEMEWPPGSSNKQQFPEIDKAEWFTVEQSKIKINPAQVSFVKQLLSILPNYQ